MTGKKLSVSSYVRGKKKIPILSPESTVSRSSSADHRVVYPAAASGGQGVPAGARQPSARPRQAPGRVCGRSHEAAEHTRDAD